MPSPPKPKSLFLFFFLFFFCFISGECHKGYSPLNRLVFISTHRPLKAISKVRSKRQVLIFGVLPPPLIVFCILWCLFVFCHGPLLPSASLFKPLSISAPCLISPALLKRRLIYILSLVCSPGQPCSSANVLWSQEIHLFIHSFHTV